MERALKPEHLSRRERQIAEAYAGGQSYRQIAEQLFIAPATVRTHLSTIYRKLGVSTKIELLRALERSDAAPEAGAITGRSSSDTPGEPTSPESEIAPLAREESADDLARAAPGIESLAPDPQANASADEALSPAPSWAGPPAERRHLTIVVVDLVGSMELSAQLDPEQMRDFLEDYQGAVATAVARFEGHVASVVGDEALVYFGWPHAHEDDAERAVRASLAARASVSALRRRGGERLAVRIGIASGLVVIGEGMGHDAAVVGGTPKLASRLRAFASPGQIVIAESTRRLVGDIFELGDLGTNSVEGIGEPVQMFAVISDRPVESRFEARSGSALLPMVGRDQELALLLERWALAKAGEGQGVLLVGEAGIGKSRIARALLDAVAEEPHTRIRYQCSPYHTDSALWPVIQQLTHAAGLASNDATETRLDKLEALLARAGGPADTAPLVADLLGLDGASRYGRLDLTPQARRARTLEALVGQLLGLASRQPVLVILEDAHWIDPTTLELIGQCLDRIAAARVLVLLTSRPDQQPVLAGHPHITRLTLNRLGRAGVAAIVARLGGDHLPGEVIDAIIARTDGVPLFVEELTKAVLETGETAVPASLYDSLMARLDRIPGVKEIAQIAACIGREFDYPLLAAVVDRTEYSLQSALDQLVRAELVFRRGTPPDASYSFKHALVQDAAYGSLLRGRREDLHVRIADCLITRHPETAAAEPELLAHHCTRAGLAEKAVPQWLHAGRKAAAHSAHLEAIGHLSKGLELLATLPETPDRAEKELALKIALGPAILATRGFGDPALVETYERARELAEQLQDDTSHFTALWGLWIYHLASERFKTAESLSTQLLSAAERHSDSAIRLQAHHAAWTTDFFRGEFASCLDHTEKGESYYDRQRHRTHKFLYGGHDPAVCSLSFRSFAEWLMGFPDRALASSQRAVDLAIEIGHPNSHAQALTTKAIVHYFRGEAEAAYEVGEAAVTLSAEHGLGMWAALLLEVGRAALASCGRGEQSLDATRESIAALQQTGVGVFGPFRRATFVDALRRAGRSGAAAESLGFLDAAQSIIDRKGEIWFQAEIHRLRGEVLLDGPAIAKQEGEAAFHRAIETARTQEARSLELRAATSLARHWVNNHDCSKAHDLLAPVYGWFTEGFDTADLKDAKALLEELR